MGRWALESVQCNSSVSQYVNTASFVKVNESLLMTSRSLKGCEANLYDATIMSQLRAMRRFDCKRAKGGSKRVRQCGEIAVHMNASQYAVPSSERYTGK